LAAPPHTWRQSEEIFNFFVAAAHSSLETRVKSELLWYFKAVMYGYDERRRRWGLALQLWGWRWLFQDEN